MYKLLTDEQKQIIIEKNLNYYYKNKEKIKERTKIYWKEYYKKKINKNVRETKEKLQKTKIFYQ